MVYTLRGLRVKPLGDPHLGKPFTNGVPLDRRGEREDKQWADFYTSLNNVSGVDVHVCVGDIFDKMIVPPSVTLGAASAYKSAAEKNPGVTYVVYRGNHDGSKDADQRSSFDLFKAILDRVENVLVIDKPDEAAFDVEGQGDDPVVLGFVPWSPFLSASDMTNYLVDDKVYDAIFGHWDLDSFGQDETPNLVPVDDLLRRTDTVFNGHVHTPEVRYYDADGDRTKDTSKAALTLHNIGSMQPYSHGEDPQGQFYVTMTPEQIEQADKSSLKDKCVRVALRPGEEVPSDLECLQVSVKHVSEDQDDSEDPNIEVESEPFDFQRLFREAFDAQEVRDGVRGEVWDIYQEHHNAEET